MFWISKSPISAPSNQNQNFCNFCNLKFAVYPVSDLSACKLSRQNCKYFQFYSHETFRLSKYPIAQFWNLRVRFDSLPFEISNFPSLETLSNYQAFQFRRIRVFECFVPKKKFEINARKIRNILGRLLIDAHAYYLHKRNSFWDLTVENFGMLTFTRRDVQTHEHSFRCTMNKRCILLIVAAFLLRCTVCMSGPDQLRYLNGPFCFAP